MPMTVQSAPPVVVDNSYLLACRRLAAPPAAVALPALPALPALLVLLALLALLALSTAVPARAQSLYGSHESLVRQNLVAQQHAYAYLRNTQELMQAVASGELVPVHGNEDFQLAGDEVSFPYARPQVKTFLEQLAHDYHAACGEPLVVTSLTRPISRQPWNASPISVHPTGMAVDLRHSDRRACRQWLESTLLALEGEGMIEAIRERWPPHYHVAVFPDPLLLPGPIGDPNGVARLTALAALHPGALPEADADGEPEAAPRHGRVHVARSARTGRLYIAQTARQGSRPSARGQGSRDGRIVIHRHAASTRHAAATRRGAVSRGAVSRAGAGHAGSASTAASAKRRSHSSSRTRATTATAR